MGSGSEEMESTTSNIHVFRPTWEEFTDFPKYIEYMESVGAHQAGIAKVIPPIEFQMDVKATCCKKLWDVSIESPVKQYVTGKNRMYQQENVPQGKTSMKDFYRYATVDNQTPAHLDDFDLEDIYWKNVTTKTKESPPPLYASDVHMSLMDCELWNLNKLGTMLDCLDNQGISHAGVTSPYLYIGAWKSSFALHVEDQNLYSINYLHVGSPKTWYGIPPAYGEKVEELVRRRYKSQFKNCPAFLRHHSTIINPSLLKEAKIPYGKVTQREGSFIITFPYSYHMGWNHGFNVAEATNFALPRWIEYGQKAVLCYCPHRKKVTVHLNMGVFENFQ